MAIEKERKFLVKSLYNLVDAKIDFNKIIQLYLDESCNVRLRMITYSASAYNNAKCSYITYKEYINDIERKEYEFEISNVDFNKTYNNKDFKYMLTKKRARYGGWEIDIYPFGLIVAEFEFDDNKPFPEILPDWIEREITGEEEYSNIYLAKNWERLNEESLSDNS